MSRVLLPWCLLLATGTMSAGGFIHVAEDAPPLVRLAGGETGRYIYQRTGRLLPVHADTARGDPAIRLYVDDGLPAGTYRLKTSAATDGGRALHLTGGGAVEVMYAAYHFAETLGVRFYLHGDVVPDRRIPFVLPELDETHAPLFEKRGLLPFHDFTQGPDWWEIDDYKAHFIQMVKLRMNLMGLHCYPEGPAGQEPLIWIGHPDDVDAKGKVAFSPPSFWASTSGSAWGYHPVPTSDFAAGAAGLFEEDDFGPSVTRGHRPKPATPEAANEIHHRAAALLGEAFGYGRGLGVQIAIGTETPLHIPRSVRARLEEKGLDPDEPDVRQAVYEGMFTRIARAYPVDYYWLWTPESWTWSKPPAAQVEAAKKDVQIALAALEKTGRPFGFGTNGWELGPPEDRGLFDNILPKDAVMSCINRNIGFNWVDPQFLHIKDRPKWAIPWLEDDSAMVLPQLWAGRLRRDAADAYAYGCNGLLGIHWRTRILAPNVSALAKAAWSQEGWNPDAGKRAEIPDGGPPAMADRVRDLPCGDFYQDMAAAWFGPEIAGEMADFFTRFDGGGNATGVMQGRATLPRPNTWLYGPGAIVADRQPWADAAKQYAFVDGLAALRARIKSPGDLERFDYWLDNFRYLRAVHEAACTRGALDAAMERVKAADDAADKIEIARTVALPARIRLARNWESMMTLLIETTNTPGELGTIANLEQSTRKGLRFIDGHDAELAAALGGELPGTTEVSGIYRGRPRIIVPTQRPVYSAGEAATLKVIVVDQEKPAEAILAWRELGSGMEREIPLRHVARNVYQVPLPETPGQGAEFHIRVKTAGGAEIVWPATAPALNHVLTRMP